MKLMHLYVFPLTVTSNGRYTPLLVSIPTPEASPAVV
jgi:hypothetical protein